jgi:hypothetical protein
MLGYIGGILLAVCAFPEAYRTIRDRECHLGWAFLLLWFSGECFMFMYSVQLNDMALLLNYGLNLVLLTPMLYFKLKTL